MAYSMTHSVAHAVTHFADRTHLDRATLARVNSILMIALIGSGLAACAFGALIFDLSRLVGAW